MSEESPPYFTKAKRGGARPGAGRKSVGGTVVRRIPLPLLDVVDLAVQHFRMGRDSPSDTKQATVTLSPVELPLFLSKVPAGFPSPADDYVERRIDLSQRLVSNPTATILVTVDGLSMIGKGIGEGDTLIVDRSREPKSGDIVVAAVAGEFTVKTLYRRGRVCELRPENPDPLYRALPFPQSEEDRIIGVVTWVLKKC